jgi:predicted aconitase with swiveling domain
MRIAAQMLNPGSADGPVLVLSEPLSFWGAFDPLTGRIIDAHHPERGSRLTGHIVMLPETRGSATASGAIAEAIRLGTAPSAIVLGKADVNLAIGALVAEALYGHACPVLMLSPGAYGRLAGASRAAIAHDGTITAITARETGR